MIKKRVARKQLKIIDAKTKIILRNLFCLLISISRTKTTLSAFFENFSYKIIPLTYATGDKISCVTWSPDSRYLAASCNDHTITIWDTKTGSLLSWFKHRKENQECLLDNTAGLIWIEKGFCLAVYSWDRLLTIYNIRTGKPIYEIKDSPYPLSFVPTGSQKNIKLRIVENKDFSCDLLIEDIIFSTKILFLRHKNPILNAYWNNTGTQIVLSTESGTLYLYQYPLKELIFKKKKHRFPIDGICWSPNDKKLVSFGDNGELYIWEITPIKKKIIPKEDSLDLFFEKIENYFSSASQEALSENLLEE